METGAGEELATWGCVTEVEGVEPALATRRVRTGAIAPMVGALPRRAGMAMPVYVRGRLGAAVGWGVLAERVERPTRKKQRKIAGHSSASAIAARAPSDRGGRSVSIQRVASWRTALTTGTRSVGRRLG